MVADALGAPVFVLVFQQQLASFCAFRCNGDASDYNLLTERNLIIVCRADESMVD
jgi:hypothetical protein